MTDYVIDADWSGKDNLTSGAALKVVRGSEFQIEFDAIADAIQSKYDSDSTVAIGSGAINNTTIGATTPATGNFSTLSIAGTAITSTAAELNVLDGVTATTAELNKLDGVTATTAELNILDGVTATTAELNILDGKSFLDEDTMASNSATGIPSQQSVKAYVDAQVSGVSVSGITSTADATAITIDSSETVKINGLTVGAGASGYGTLQANTILGEQALDSVTTAIRNVAVGGAALNNITSGTFNVAVGHSAANGMTTSSFNVAVGAQALSNGGNDNVAVGYYAMRGASSSAIRNIAIGSEALEFVTGSGNVAVGYLAGQSITSGPGNTAVGRACMDKLTTGSENTALGMYAGDVLTTGYNNTSIGYNSDPSSATASNEVTLGDTNITALRCNVTSITSLSDIRDKTNIADLSNCAAFVKELEPVSFDWNRRDESMQGVHAHGFIAQQLKAAQESTGHQIPGLVFEENPDKLEAAYGNLLPTVVAALKEALVEIDELKAKVAALENA